MSTGSKVDFSTYSSANKWVSEYCGALDRFWNRRKWDMNDEYFSFYANDIEMYWNGKLAVNNKIDLFNRWTSFVKIHKTFASHYQLSPRYDTHFIEFVLPLHYLWFDNTETVSIENCANYFDQNGKICQQHWFATNEFRKTQDIMHDKFRKSKL